MNKFPDSNEKASPVASKPGRSAARKVVWKEHAVQLDVLRSEVERVHIVDTDFVILLKSKRRVLLRDGALKSATLDEFAIEFSDETIAGKTFFAMAEPLPASYEAWSDVDDGMSLEQVAVPEQPAPLIEAAKPEPAPAPAPLPQDKGTWSSTMLYAAGGGVLLAVAAAAQAKKNQVSALVSTKLGIEGATGPLIGQQLVKVYDQVGDMLTTGVMKNGLVNVALPKGYSGPVMLVLADTNGANPDYVSENTGEKLSLGSQQLRAMAVIPAGTEYFSVSITPITELAVQLAFAKNQLVAMDHWSQQALSAQVVQDNNAAVAKALGLEDILGPFITIIDGEGQKNSRFVESDGLSAAEKYGHFLAVLSASDVVSGSIDKTLAAYLVQLIGVDDAATQELQQMWIQGAKTFELGNMAGLANLPMPQLGQRELLKPSLLTRWAAQKHIQADDNAALSQGKLMLESGTTPVSFPVALPASSLEGDQLVLFVEVLFYFEN